MTLEGSLDERELREVLDALAKHRRTGILTVQGRREIIALSFLEGEVVSADALNQTLEDGLGKVLDDLELVTPEDFAGLAAEHQAGGGRVVELVVERGFVTQRDLLGALRLHTYRLSRQALSWREGEFKFYQGEEVSYEEGITPIPTAELLFRASRDLANPRLFEGSFPEPSSVFARNPGAFHAGGRGSRGGEGDVDVVEKMGEDAVEVFSRVNGETSVRGLVRATGVPEFRVTYLLHRWRELGLVDEVGERTEETAASSVLEVEPPTPYTPVLEEEEESPPREPSELGRQLARLFRVESPPAARLRLWPARVAGLVLLAALVALTVARPGRYRQGLFEPAASQPASGTDVRYERIHRAAATFFLLYGRYPEEASQLIDLGLISPLDLVDARGREIQFSSTTVSYVISAPPEESGPRRAVTGTIIGNFLLDPDFGLGEVSEEPPLVLLD